MRMLAILAAVPLLACSSGTPASGTSVSETSTTVTGTGDAAAAPTGGGTSRSWDLSGFDRVALQGSDDVRITTGPFAVRAEGPAKALDDLKIEKTGSELRIGRRDHSGSWHGGDGNVVVYVTLPAARAVSVSGSGDLSLDRATGDFAASASGSGGIALADVDGGAVALTLSGSGDIAAKGKATAVKLSISGSGDIAAAGLTAARGTVSIAGTGSVTTKIDGPATVSLSGTGDADLGANARCRVSSAGTGEARCGG